MYHRDEFGLNDKADAAEALALILQLLHAVLAGTNERTREAATVNDLNLEAACHRCFVHEQFSLDLLQYMECECGAQFGEMPKNPNTFGLQVNVDQILEFCSERARSSKRHAEYELTTNRLPELLSKCQVKQVFIIHC